MKNENLIITAADQAYVIPLTVMIISAATTSSVPLNIAVLDGGIAEKSKLKIIDDAKKKSQSITISFIKSDTSLFKNYHTLGHISTSTFARLNLEDLIETSSDRIIYLDSDVVVDKDISELFKVSLDNKPVGAVRGTGAPEAANPYGIGKWKEIGLDPKTPCINAGLLVIDLPKWKSHQIGKKALQFLESQGGKLKMGDQEALNAALRGNWHQLDLRWNQTHIAFSPNKIPSEEFKKELTSYGSELLINPYIIHYTSARKPWKVRCLHPLRGKYYSHWKKIPGEYSKYKLTSLLNSLFYTLSLATKRNHID